MGKVTRRCGMVISLFLIIGFWFFYFHYVFAIINVPSASMEPTVMTGDYGLCQRLGYPFSQIQYGDIIIFEKDGNLLCKRVIGLPGDVISFENGNCIRNGESLAEPYVMPDSRSEGEVYSVPDNAVFVLGDNREDSLDSRFWESAYVYSDNIYGRLVFAAGIGGGMHMKFL